MLQHNSSVAYAKPLTAYENNPGRLSLSGLQRMHPSVPSQIYLDFWQASYQVDSLDGMINQSRQPIGHHSD